MSGHGEYTDGFVTGLEWMWGEGFLSPGGADEVRELIADNPLRGCHVLDIGCGLGAIDVLLVREYGAASVLGLEVEPALVERAQATVARADLSDQVTVVLTSPGPLPIAEESIDVVFSKDSMIHIPDKPALFRDIRRVLKPGGRVIASDWLRGGEESNSVALREWLDVVGLTFAMLNAEQTEHLLRDAGFENVRSRDRNAWYREVIREEIACVTGDGQIALAARIGVEAAAARVRSSLAKQVAVERGDLRPTHLFACKPDR